MMKKIIFSLATVIIVLTGTAVAGGKSKVSFTGRIADLRRSLRGKLKAARAGR